MQRKIQGDIYHIGLMWFPQTKEKFRVKLTNVSSIFFFRVSGKRQKMTQGKGGSQYCVSDLASNQHG